MNKIEFLEELELILNLPENTLTEETRFEDLQTWDSTAILSLIGLLEMDLEVDVDVDTLRK